MNVRNCVLWSKVLLKQNVVLAVIVQIKNSRNFAVSLLGAYVIFWALCRRWSSNYTYALFRETKGILFYFPEAASRCNAHHSACWKLAAISLEDSSIVLWLYSYKMVVCCTGSTWQCFRAVQTDHAARLVQCTVVQDYHREIQISSCGTMVILLSNTFSILLVQSIRVQS